MLLAAIVFIAATVYIFSGEIKIFITLAATVIAVSFLALLIFSPEDAFNILDAIRCFWLRHTQPDIFDELSFRLHIISRHVFGGY